jgi:hypothetical protein
MLKIISNYIYIMAKFGKKDYDIQRFGAKLSENGLKFGRKASDALERVGPMISVIGAGTGQPELVAGGAVASSLGRATSNLLRKN